MKTKQKLNIFAKMYHTAHYKISIASLRQAMHHRLAVFLYFLGCFVVPHLTFAQTPTDSLVNRMNKLGVPEIITGKALTEEKIIGASRSVRKLEDLPITVYVINQEDIFRNGYTSLTDVLKMVPGIRVSQPGNGFSGETFLVRGLEGNSYTKILLNNLPIQPAVSGTLSIAEQLPIAQVEKIEIIYGSASAVYGADAMAGVVNIITKGSQNSSFAQVNAITGNYGYRHVNFMVGGKIGKNKDIIQYSLYGNQGVREQLNIINGNNRKVFSPLRFALFDSLLPSSYTDSDEQISQFIRNTPDVVRSLGVLRGFPFYKGSYLQAPLSNMPQESYLLAGTLKYRNFQLSFHEMYRTSHSSLGRQPLYFGYQDASNQIKEKQQITALNYTKGWQKLTVSANLMYLRHRYDPQSSLATNYDNLGKSYIYQASDDFFGEAVINYNLTKKWELTSGVSYKVASALPTTRDLLEPFNPDDYKPFTNNRPKPDSILGNFGYNPTIVNNFGVFAQAYFSSKRWNIVIGWRYDKPSNYAEQSYQRLAALYKLTPKTSLRLSGGYAFKAPALTTAYQSVAVADREINPATGQFEPTGRVIYQVVPNPNLKPEESGGIELGLRYAVNSNTYLDVIAFGTSVQQLIIATPDTIRAGDPRYPRAATNDRVRTYRNGLDTRSFLVGLQVVGRAKNIIPAIQLQTNFAYSLQLGTEVFGNDFKLKSISQHRQVPVHTLQWSIAANPYKKLYLNFDHVLMSGWYRRYVPSDVSLSSLPKQFIKGYYTLDFVGRYYFTKNMSSYIKVINVFDAEYGGLSATGLDVDMYYMPQFGRNVQVGVSFQLE